MCIIFLFPVTPVSASEGVWQTKCAIILWDVPWRMGVICVCCICVINIVPEEPVLDFMAPSVLALHFLICPRWESECLTG